MGIKRHTLHLDTEDLEAIRKLARQERRKTGVYVTAAGIIRRLMKEYLAKKGGG